MARNPCPPPAPAPAWRALGNRDHVADGLSEVERGAVDLGDAKAAERLDLPFEDGPTSACEEGHVGDAVPGLLFQHLGEEGHVAAVVGADGDGGGVLLARGLGDLVGALVEADVDGLRALASEDAGYRRRRDVVAVADGRRYDEAGWARHGREYSARGERVAGGAGRTYYVVTRSALR